MKIFLVALIATALTPLTMASPSKRPGTQQSSRELAHNAKSVPKKGGGYTQQPGSYNPNKPGYAQSTESSKGK
ncbi:hypothetical protein H4R34_006118, partial [Dimargaris verticillata]